MHTLTLAHASSRRDETHTESERDTPGRILSFFMALWAPRSRQKPEEAGAPLLHNKRMRDPGVHLKIIDPCVHVCVCVDEYMCVYLYMSRIFSTSFAIRNRRRIFDEFSFRVDRCVRFLFLLRRRISGSSCRQWGSNQNNIFLLLWI